MTESEKTSSVIGWLAAAVVLGGLILLLLIYGCADKKTNHYIQQVLPVVDKPPVECPKHLCRHGQECEECEDGEKP